jgi:hypothetical protein
MSRLCLLTGQKHPCFLDYIFQNLQVFQAITNEEHGLGLEEMAQKCERAVFLLRIISSAVIGISGDVVARCEEVVPLPETAS